MPLAVLDAGIISSAAKKTAPLVAWSINYGLSVRGSGELSSFFEISMLLTTFISGEVILVTGELP